MMNDRRLRGSADKYTNKYIDMTYIKYIGILTEREVLRRVVSSRLTILLNDGAVLAAIREYEIGRRRGIGRRHCCVHLDLRSAY